MTFFLLLFFVVLYCRCSKYNSQLGVKTFIWYASIIMILISGLRHYAVGNDTYAYIMEFEAYENVTWNQVFEDFFRRYIMPIGNFDKDPGWGLFIKILYVFCVDSRMFLFIVAVMLILPLGIFIYKNSDNLRTVLFSYCFYATIFFSYLPNSAMRQSLALSFLLWAYLFVRKKKVLYALLFILIASFFHKSALSSLLLLPMLYYGNIKLLYKIFLIPFVIMLVFQEQIAIILVDSNEVYSGYTTNSYYSTYQEGKPYLILLLLLFYYCMGWLYLNHYKKGNFDKNQRLLFYGCALTLVFSPLVWVNPSALRIISYFVPCMCIIAGNALSQIKYGKILFTILISLILLKSLSGFGSYHFMWQKMELHERYAQNLRIFTSNSNC